MNGCYEFGPFRVDSLKRVLLRDGQTVSLSNQAFDVLWALLESQDRILGKDELLEKVWPDTTVDENNLTVAIAGLRKALGEVGNERRYILTIPGRGYRFVGEARLRPEDPDPAVHADAELTGGNFPAAGMPVFESICTPVGGAGDAGEASETVRLYPRGFERKTGARGSAWRLGIFAVGAAIVFGVLAYPSLSRRFSRGRSRERSMRSIHSVAVLPFKMIGSAEGDQYLGVGLADALISKLSNLSQLKVTPTGSVLRYGQGDTNPVAAGRELAVDAVLGGEIQRSDNQIKVTVQLVGISDGATLWADTFVENLTDVFALEDSISAGASEHLALKLTNSEKKGLARHVTENAEAYQSYMKGRYFWDKDTEEPMLKSIRYFQQAIAQDSGFALPYVGIADAYSELVIQGYLAAGVGLPKVKTAATTALQLDPALAEPHNSLGIVAWGYDRDWTMAEKEFDRAAELDPESAATHSSRAFFLMTMKRFDQSIAEAKRAAELNPASASANTTVGYAYFAAQRYGESSVWLGKALDLDPSVPFPRALLAVDDALEGKKDEALAEYSKIREVATSGKDPLVSAMAAYACAIAGDRKDALTVLDRLQDSPPTRYVDPYVIAIVYSGLGDDNATLDWLERMFHERSLSVAFFNFDPFVRKFQANPRYQELIRRAGVTN
jgi:DNA-binding winged helix-turn-helix (wHTH) protein/TolB-like protein/Flp pilus assembly protein TadD